MEEIVHDEEPWPLSPVGSVAAASVWARLVDSRAKWFCAIRRLPLRFGYAVVDIETTGLDWGKHEVVGFGLAYDRYLIGCVRMYGSDGEFRGFARELVVSLLRDGVPVYAWNKDFEESWLDVYGRRELLLRRYEKKDPALRLGIELLADGKTVPRLWERWLRYRDAEALLKILWRATYDAYIEAAALYRGELRSLEPEDAMILPA